MYLKNAANCTNVFPKKAFQGQYNRCKSIQNKYNRSILKLIKILSSKHGNINILLNQRKVF